MIAEAVLACAIGLVHPVTLGAVIEIESGGRAAALNVNHLSGPQPHPADAAEAAALARRYIAAGHTVDIGLTQINSANLPALGLTVEQALDPCINVKGGATILAADYRAASAWLGEGQAALLAALSAYNTGSFSRGFANGYVCKYIGWASGTGRPITSFPGVPWRGTPGTVAVRHDTPRPAMPDPYTADQTVFVGRKIDVQVQ